MSIVNIEEISFSAGSTDYKFEDAEVKTMLVDIVALNGQYEVDVS